MYRNNFNVVRNHACQILVSYRDLYFDFLRCQSFGTMEGISSILSEIELLFRLNLISSSCYARASKMYTYSSHFYCTDI